MTTENDIDNIPLPGMPEPQLEVAKLGTTLPISAEMIAMQEQLRRAVTTNLLGWVHSTPEDRTVRAAEWKRRLAEERANAPYVPLTLGTLIEAMGWTPKYAEHLVQPYCDCGPDREGWEYCQHARDLGFGA